MEVKKVKDKLLHKAISGVIFAAIFTLTPTLINLGIDGYQDFRRRTEPIDNMIEVNEFSVRAGEDSESILDYVITWDRCVNTYLPAMKNWELFQITENGVTNILAKSEVEEIDFNIGCNRFEFTMENEEWVIFNEPDEHGAGELLMQLTLDLGNDVHRTHLFTSDPFPIKPF